MSPRVVPPPDHRGPAPDVTIIAELLVQRPGDPQAHWARALIERLAARGRRVRVLCDGSDVPDLARVAHVIARRRIRTHGGRDPAAFARWARRTLAALRHEEPHGPRLSLSPFVWAEHWMPIGQPARSLWLRVWNYRARPSTLAVEALHALWLPGAALAERRAALDHARRGGVLLRAGASLVHSRWRAAEPLSLGYASLDTPVPQHDRPRVRATLRAALGLEPDAPVLLASSLHGDARSAFFAGLAQARTPVACLLAGPSPHHAIEAARARGAARRVIPLGPSNSMPQLAVAADAVVCWRSHRGPLNTGRLAADAIANGRPLLLAPHAAGQSLFQQALHLGHGPPGIALEHDTPDAWASAIDMLFGSSATSPSLSEPAALSRCTNAAEQAAPLTSLDRVLDRLESALCGPAAPTPEPQSAEIDRGPAVPAVRSM